MNAPFDKLRANGIIIAHYCEIKHWSGSGECLSSLAFFLEGLLLVPGLLPPFRQGSKNILLK
jgi:hypothetical protein